MAPNPHNLTLSKDAFEGSGGQGGQSGGGGDKSNETPSNVRLVVSGSAGVKAVDSLAVDWKKNGFGQQKGQTNLAGIVYELGHGEKADATMEAFSVSNQAPGNIPLTLVHPLVKGVNGELPPLNSSPHHAMISFSLPTITSADQVTGDNEEKWLSFLKEASERKLTVELALNGNESTQEAVEKLLGKAWDQESEQAKKEGIDVNKQGIRIIFDTLASPPLSHSSSQLLRSKELENWSDFIRRLALHPRVFLKLSPLPLPSVLLPAALTAPVRTADAPTSSVSSTLAGALQAANGATAAAVTAAETTVASQDRKGELLRRLRIFLDTALEAFGEERIVWAATMASGSATVTKASSTTGEQEQAVSEVEEWFEICRESLTGSGLNKAGLDNIFAENASRVYLM